MAQYNKQKQEVFESFEKNVQDVTIDEYIQAEVLKYGINVSIFRISPAFKDGLTPIKRRILYSFYKDGALYNKPRKKASELLGRVSAYHPHGNLSINKTFVNEIKAYESNAILFDTHGNTGSATGQQAAAVRYLDTRLSKFATFCFFHPDDYYEELLDMVETYTRDKLEPVTLPSRYPYLLLSNTTGIGWGNSFSSVPFNTEEVFRLTQALIHEPNMTNVYLYPDSPRGYDIVETDDIVDICESGFGTLKIQARIDYHEEYHMDKKGEKKITKRYLSVMGLPEQTLMDNVTKKISSMILDKTLSGIITWEDRCHLNNDGSEHIEFWLILTNDADPDVIKETLYKKTQLRHFLNINLNFAARTSMRHLGIKDSLLIWISNRVSYKSKVISKKAYKLKERIHVLEGIINLLSPKNLENTISIIRHASDDNDAIVKLIKTYGVTSYQASRVTDIKLSNLNRAAKTNFENELNDCKRKLAEVNQIIGNTDRIKEIICEELEEGIKLFGKPRSCRVIHKDALKPVEFKYNIAITKKYIKKLSNNSKSIGSLAADDEVVAFFTNVPESETMYIVDDMGKVYSINISKIKPTELSSRGNELKGLISLKGSPIRAFRPLINDENFWVISMFTESGIIKNSPLDKYITNRSEIQGITLNEGDKVCSVDLFDPTSFETDSHYKLIYTKNGFGIMIDFMSIPQTDRISKGSNYLNLEDGDKVAGVCNTTSDEVFVVTTKGYCKVCELDDIFKTSKRRVAMIRLTGLSEDDSVFKIIPFDKEGKYTFILSSGERFELNKSEIPVTTRVSKGKKLIPVKKSASIIKIRES